jgi:nicotinamide mononucleotide transporter
MVLPTLTQLFTLLINTSSLEWACNITALASIILAARNNVLTWSIGIVSCALFTVLFIDAKLYAEALLQVFFILTSAWGWWHWSVQQRKPAAPISTLSLSTGSFWLLVALAGGALYAWGLQRWTDAASPWLDSQVLSLSMLAQWWLMRRNIYSWWVWLTVNTISVPLYISRELYVSAMFYALYWLLAVFAYLHWLKHLAIQTTDK